MINLSTATMSSQHVIAEEVLESNATTNLSFEGVGDE